MLPYGLLCLEKEIASLSPPPKQEASFISVQ